jgi:diadenylate cyclase
MDAAHDDALLRALALVAPGTALRDGVQRVLSSGRGALIIIGDSPEVLNICSGGFLLDAAFSPQRLAELAKMDGAIILDGDASRIARANVHLVPNPNVFTSETGTRHRTAERAARSLSAVVIAVSESRKEIQVYVGEQSHQLLTPSRLLERSNQALQTLERYRARLDLVSRKLNALEVEDLVTVRHVMETLQRAEVVVRIAAEIEHNLVELGSDGRLVQLQLEELMVGVVDDRRRLLIDYLPGCAGEHGRGDTVGDALATVAGFDNDDLFDHERLAEALQLGSGEAELDQIVAPRGHRLLCKLPQVTEAHVERVVDHFGSLRKVLGASAEEIEVVEGIGATRAKALKEGTVRLAGDSIIDQH